MSKEFNVVEEFPVLVEDGDYNAQIEKIDTRNQEGVPQVVWFIRILDEGIHENALVKKVSNLSSRKSVHFLKSELGQLGLVIQDRKQFAEKLPEMIGKILRIRAKTSEEGWQSYRIIPESAPSEKKAEDGSSLRSDEPDPNLGW